MIESELPKTYDPKQVESRINQYWQEGCFFHAVPDNRPRDRRFSVVIPPPNVTGALHLGHALNNTLQDTLVRWHRMMGHNTLWIPGTDHAGIATQAVVEKRLKEEENLNRHAIGRDALVERIWNWKDEYEARIINQLKLMGCSCDFDRTRFTLDEGCSRAVRETFFKLFMDGLIVRGKRLVNWDCELQTAVADDEVYHENIRGKFYYFRYPILPQAETPQNEYKKKQHYADVYRHAREGMIGKDFLLIATTRPETMLGDTAVAVHPSPETVFSELEERLEADLRSASAKERPELEARLAKLDELRETHLPLLIKLRDLANKGQKLLLPLMDREIPLVTDEWADPTKGTGCVKITPAHDPNDYEVGLRNDLPMINILNPDGSINENGGKYCKLDRFEARVAVLNDLKEMGLVEKEEDHEHEVGHSDRSKTPIEPYLSDQWFLKMDTDVSERTLDAVRKGDVKFIPDRYKNAYLDWLGEKRDWCISRQLWWGHRIPVWSSKRYYLTESNWHGEWLEDGMDSVLEQNLFGEHGYAIAIRVETGEVIDFRKELSPVVAETEGEYQVFVCLFEEESKDVELLNEMGFQQDPDVLDTWFSSALWPLSTLGWPSDSEQRAAGFSPRDLESADGGFNPADLDLSAGAWLFTWTTYGTWLPGDERGYVSRRPTKDGSQIINDIPGDVYDADDPDIKTKAAEKMDGEPVYLGQEQAQEALRSIQDVCSRHPVSLIAAAIMRDHVHVLCQSEMDNTQLLQLFKGNTAKKLNEKFPLEKSPRWWTRSGSKRKIKKGSNLEPAIAYVEQQSHVLSVWSFRLLAAEYGTIARAKARGSEAGKPFLSNTSHQSPDTSHGLLQYFYPTNVLITSRDIITLWVVRMVLMGLYNADEKPFDEVYIHPKILDGRGVTMSKSKGNGVDPLDIVEAFGADALRWGLAGMTTETQDIRMPVSYKCPHCEQLTQQTEKNMFGPDGNPSKVLACAHCKKQFATRWASQAQQAEHGLALMVSDKFEAARNFTNKLWNAARFAFMNLDGEPPQPLPVEDLPTEDRWILAELSETVRAVNDALAHYQYSRAVLAMRNFFWDALCDWYLELVKYRISENHAAAEARQVLAFCMDQTLRLMHPVIPFITERLWQQLGENNRFRGMPGLADLAPADVLTLAEFPPAAGYPLLDNAEIRETFADLQTATRAVREVRNTAGISPKDRVTVSILAMAERAAHLQDTQHILKRMAGIDEMQAGPDVQRPAGSAIQIIGPLQIFVHDIVDDATERQRVEKELAGLQKRIKSMEGKLNNEGYVRSAPPELVDETRQMLADATQQKQAFEEILNLLSC